jgi:hypothetical protein
MLLLFLLGFISSLPPTCLGQKAMLLFFVVCCLKQCDLVVFQCTLCCRFGKISTNSCWGHSSCHLWTTEQGPQQSLQSWSGKWFVSASIWFTLHTIGLIIGWCCSIAQLVASNWVLLLMRTGSVWRTKISEKRVNPFNSNLKLWNHCFNR